MAIGTGPADEARIVGRRHELAALAAAVRRLDRPIATFVVVTGEPGIGKTRLLDELARRGEHGGPPRAHRPRHRARARPAVRRLGRRARRSRRLARAPSGCSGMLGDRVGELARVLPSAGAPPAAGAARRALPGAPRRARAAGADRRRRARSSSLLDDLHWADGASLELLVHLLRRPPRAPLLVAIAFRAGRLPPAVLGGARGGAAATAGSSTCSSAPLSPGEVGRRCSARRPPRRHATELHRVSGGNPVLPAAARPRGRRRRCPARRRGGGVPAPVAAALGAGDRRAGRAGAAARPGRRGGRRSGRARARGRRRGARRAGGARGARRARGARSCCAATDVPRRYRFRHPIVRRAVYESAGEGWRLAAHARAAAELERRGGSLAARAHHVERCAATGDEAAVALLVAGRPRGGGARARPARSAGSTPRCGCCRSAPTTSQRRLALLVPLATALAATGQLERALATLLEALALIPARARRAARPPRRGVRGVREPARPPPRRARPAAARARASCRR